VLSGIVCDIFYWCLLRDTVGQILQWSIHLSCGMAAFVSGLELFLFVYHVFVLVWVSQLKKFSSSVKVESLCAFHLFRCVVMFIFQVAC